MRAETRRDERVRHRAMPVAASIHWKPLRDPHYVIASLHPGQGGLRQLFVDQPVLVRLQALARATPADQLIGLLIGQRWDCPLSGARWLLIDSLVEGPAAVPDVKALTKVLGSLVARRRGEGAECVGWYCGTTSSDAHLSRMFAAVHAATFKDSWQTTMVLANNGRAGAFFLHDVRDARWFQAPFYELTNEARNSRRQPAQTTSVTWPDYITTAIVAPLVVAEPATPPRLRAAAPAERPRPVRVAVVADPPPVEPVAPPARRPVSLVRDSSAKAGRARGSGDTAVARLRQTTSRIRTGIIASTVAAKTSVLSLGRRVADRAAAAAQARKERAATARQARTAREAEERARREELARRRAEEEAARRAQQEAERAAQQNAERAAKLEAERVARLEAERAATLQAERAARLEAERRARQEAEERARQQAEERAKQQAEERARQQAAERARQEAIELARQEAVERARQEAIERAKQEAAAHARVQAAERARLEAAERARQEEQRAREEAQRRAKLEAEQRARRDAERQAAAAVDRPARPAVTRLFSTAPVTEDLEDTTPSDGPYRYLALARREGFQVSAQLERGTPERPETVWLLNEPESGLRLTVVTTDEEVREASLHYNIRTDDDALLRLTPPEHRDVESRIIYVREPCVAELRSRCRRLRATGALEREWKVAPTLHPHAAPA